MRLSGGRAHITHAFCTHPILQDFPRSSSRHRRRAIVIPGTVIGLKLSGHMSVDAATLCALGVFAPDGGSGGRGWDRDAFCLAGLLDRSACSLRAKRNAAC